MARGRLVRAHFPCPNHLCLPFGKVPCSPVEEVNGLGKCRPVPCVVLIIRIHVYMCMPTAQPCVCLTIEVALCRIGISATNGASATTLLTARHLLPAMMGLSASAHLTAMMPISLPIAPAHLPAMTSLSASEHLPAVMLLPARTPNHRCLNCNIQ